MSDRKIWVYALALASGLVMWGSTARAATVPFFSTYPKLDKNRWFVSNGWVNGEHQSCEWRADAISASESGLVLTLSDQGGKVRPLGCAELHTNLRTGYGVYEARIRTAAGSGLNTAFFTYAGPSVGVPEHSEIDFEFLGKNPRTVQLNYFIGGKPQGPKVIDLGFDASAAVHTYSFDWAPDKIRWYADGKLIHETADGAAIPATPGRIYLTLWSGTKMEDAWLGPFRYEKPVQAEFASVKYTPHY